MPADISVIIPVYNDPDGISDTLQCLKSQDYDPGCYEILVVDNGSSDDTKSVAEEVASNSPVRINVLQEHLKGSYAARNRGAMKAKGDLLCFVDANMSMGSDYLSKIAKHFNENTTDYLGCRVELIPISDTLASKYERVFAFPIHDYLAKMHFTPTCCLSIRRSVLEAVGLFDPRIESGEDLHFGRKVYAAGFRQAYADDIVIRHPARWQFVSLVRKAERTARGHTQLAYYYPKEFGHHYRGQISVLNLFPKNIRELSSRIQERCIKVSLLERFVLLFLPIPLRIFGAVAAIKELNRLKGQSLESDDQKENSFL